jgi:hypothetical protein
MNDPFTERLLSVLDSAARVGGDVEEGSALRLATRLGIGRFVRFRTGERTDTSEPDGERILVGLEQSFVKEAAEELSATLTGRGIQHFFVKGMAIADRLYGTGEREMADIDLHVAPAAQQAVREVLEDLGYYIPPDEEQSGPAALRSGLFAGRCGGSSPLESVGLDLAWGLDPVVRLLPRPDRHVPQQVWDSLDLSGTLPVPKDAHHVVLLIHHLVHHDMLHFKGLVDLALMWPNVSEEASPDIEVLAKQLGVWRATRLLASVLHSDFGVSLVPAGPTPADWRGKRARRMLDPVRWCTWASNATDAEFAEINMNRIRRRLVLLDSLLDAPGLLADAVIPPREYLKWRWPEARSSLEAQWFHMARVAGKLVAR